MQARSEAYKEAVVGDLREVTLRAVVGVIDPDMEQGAVSGSPQDADVSRAAQLWNKKFQVTANYASLEPCRWLLDGNTGLLPGEAEDLPDWEIGMVGLELSGPDGVFKAPQFAQIVFSGVHILQACSVAFSDKTEDGVAEDFVVEVFSQGVPYFRREITGNHDALVSVTAFKVIDPDAIKVTVTKWSLPKRRMRVVEIVPGIYEEWTGDQIAGFSLKQQADISCLTLPYGTASIVLDNQSRRFDPRSKDGAFQMLEERQGIQISMAVALPDGSWESKALGVYYQHSGGWRTSENAPTIKWDLVDIIGLLAGRTYLHPEGEPVPATLKGWLEALAGQLGKNFRHRVRVDPEYAGLPASIDKEKLDGGMACGEILRHVCMATGTFPRADAATGYLAAEPVWHEGNKITLDNLNCYPSMSANEDAAAVTVNGLTVPGNDPAAGKTIEVESPFISTEEQKRALAEAILSTCGGDRIELTGRGDPAGEVGDLDVVWLDEETATCARRVLQDLSFSGGVLQSCKSALVRGAGNIFTFTQRVKFLESGVFTVPEGVWRLRAILVGPGSGGENGTDGQWNNYTNQWMGDRLYPPPPPGRDGANGLGGKVLEVIFDVNPGQQLAVNILSESMFGPYSSGRGQRYPNGYSDIATGEVYARSGVTRPLPGSGDGGKGGRQGLDGSWYLQGKWFDDPSLPAGGYWGEETVLERDPAKGKPGIAGASGCVIVYWEPPEVIPA